MVHTVSRYNAIFNILSKANKSGYGQFYIVNFAEATTEQLENNQTTGVWLK
jgi:hypothetical protein